MTVNISFRNAGDGERGDVQPILAVDVGVDNGDGALVAVRAV